MSEAVEQVDFRNVVNWDTDSIKTTNQIPPELIGTNMGSWGFEFKAEIMKCVAPKCYSYTFHTAKGQLDFNIKAKGISKKAIAKELKRLELINKKFDLFDNFDSSLEFTVLQAKHVIGGIALIEINKKIKR